MLKRHFAPMRPNSFRPRTRAACFAATAVLLSFTPVFAGAFPPYRSTDAATADPWELEPRLGLLQIQRHHEQNELAAPLFRLNVGFPGDLELITEAEYAPDPRELGDAAAGLKWVPLRRRFALGTEVLALLPLPSRPGAGVEATSIASYFGDPMRLHLNVGAFLDARGDSDELGHKASLLGELIVGPVRPGLELTMKSVRGEDAQVAGGGGAIWNLGLVDLRAGLHFGVTEAAPDLRASFWVSSKLSLAGE